MRANTTVIDLDGDETLRSVRLAGGGGETTLSCAALFSFIGADPSSEWLSGCAALDDRGFVLTDRSLERRAPRRPMGARSAAVPSRSRRAIPVSSPSATSAAGRPSESPPRSAKVRPRCGRCTSTSRSHTERRPTSPTSDNPALNQVLGHRSASARRLCSSPTSWRGGSVQNARRRSARTSVCGRRLATAPVRRAPSSPRRHGACRERRRAALMTGERRHRRSGRRQTVVVPRSRPRF